MYLASSFKNGDEYYMYNSVIGSEIELLLKIIN